MNSKEDIDYLKQNTSDPKSVDIINSILARNKELEDFLVWLHDERLKPYSSSQYGKGEILKIIGVQDGSKNI
jgi:hypothetical protein